MSKSRFNRNVGKWHGGYQWRMSVCPQTETPVISRQVKRALQRIAAHIFMRENYGPEPRRIRRSMALMLAKRKVANGTSRET